MNDKTTAAILDERGADYGSYAVQASLAQRLKDVIASQYGHRNLPASQRESLDMFCTKISRIICGNNNKIDSWQDIEGYAALIVKELKEGGGRVHTDPSFGRRPAPSACPPPYPPVPVPGAWGATVPVPGMPDRV